MKYTLLCIVLLCFTAEAFSQETEQADPESVFGKQDPLPEKGDFSIGFDAIPFAEYIGNIFNNTQNNSVGADFVGNNQQIFGKYFLSDDMAVRGRLRLDQDVTTNRNRVMQDNQEVPDPNVEVVDEWTNNSTFVRLGGGVEFRKGEGRVIGVFGGEASFIYGRTSTKYDYGNPITEGNQSPTTTTGFSQVNGGRFERLSEEAKNKQLGVGLNGFAGIEYFVAPKISIGAEFTLGVDFIKDYREQDTYEYWDSISNSVESRQSVFEGGNSLTVFTGNYGGSINLMFYF
ncbi:hypothetical protein [Fodinibius sp. Rm-B-1B1-1]|uniref:hypothetical protein n=1 Tax=Fodinibius alkaliphilus TaxID=3140241 RepID=UPI003159E0CE